MLEARRAVSECRSTVPSKMRSSKITPVTVDLQQ